MARRLFNLVLATVAIVVVSPLCLVAVIGIRVSGPGSVLYRARRIGRNGREFVLYKFRTMRTAADGGAPITAAHDPRVFPFGAWLRKWKVDELPQLFNVLKGDMSIVGPRPEDPAIVRQCYTAAHHQTLAVLPGLASPGSIYNYTHEDEYLTGEDATAAYKERLLPIKLDLDAMYVRHASLAYDVRIILRTVNVLLARALGRRHFDDPPEMKELGWRR
jgi:lipopolysaccharide/colanic/teichoic acid biosynthesis glycosyltransferase